MALSLSELRKRFFPIFLAYIAVLFYHTSSFISIEEFAGRDLIGAFSLVKSFGLEWSQQWFLGFPKFHFYPPGFFFTADVAGWITGDIVAFKLLIYLSLFFFPLAVYYCFFQLFNRRTALTSVILSFAVVFLREPFSLLYQTLQVGLVAQMAAIPFLFVFIGTLWRNGRGSAYLLGLLMAAMVLVHPYIAAVAAVYTLIYVIITEDIFRGATASLGFLLTAWWWIPVIEKSWYMQTYTGPTGKLANWPWLFLPLAFLDRSKEAVSLVITSLFLLLIGTLDFGLPIQFYRFYIYGQIFAVLAATPGLKKVIDRYSDRVEPELLIAVVFLSFLAPVIAVDVSPDWRSDVEVQGVAPEDGRMIVETSHSDLYNSYVPIQQIPLESNVTVVNGLYADQSISSPYLLGLEKAFAENPVPNPIAVEANLTSQQLEKRFQYFGIDYALVRTEHAREKLSFMKKVAENGEFILLKRDGITDRRFEGVPVKGDYDDWKRLNRDIFRKELVYIVYKPDGERAKKISDSYMDNITSSRQNSYGIKRKSISPETKSQALFGLRYTN